MYLYCFWNIYSTIYLRWRGDENVAIKMFANPLYVSSHLPCLPAMAQRTLPLFCYSKWRDFISILSSYVRIPTAIDAPARVISTTGDNPWAAYRIINFTTNFAFILFENKLNTHILDVNWGCRLFLANVNIIATTPDWKFDGKSLRWLTSLKQKCYVIQFTQSIFDLAKIWYYPLYDRLRPDRSAGLRHRPSYLLHFDMKPELSYWCKV